MKTKNLIIFFIFLLVFPACNWFGEEDEESAELYIVYCTGFQEGNVIDVVIQAESSLNNPTFKVDPPYSLISSKKLDNGTYTICANRTVNGSDDGDVITLRAQERGTSQGVWCTAFVHLISPVEYED